MKRRASNGPANQVAAAIGLLGRPEMFNIPERLAGVSTAVRRQAGRIE